MNKCQVNRKIVQQGLDLRAAKRREEARMREAAAKEAAHDKAERNLHEEINFHSKVFVIEQIAVQIDEDRAKQEAIRRAHRRELEANREAQKVMFMKRNFYPMFIAIFLYILYDISAIKVWLAIAGTVLCGLYIIANGVAYLTRNHTNFEREGENYAAENRIPKCG